MCEQKRPGESATDPARVIAKMQVPQHLERHIGNIGSIPTPPDSYRHACTGHLIGANLILDLARARSASTSRSRGSAVVTRELISVVAAAATSSMARSKAASFAFEGVLKPLSLRTNCSDAARISVSVAGGSKLNKVRIFLHITHARTV